jgi:putative FmdB family regulatory protein
MPTYEYTCKECGEHLEVFQSFSEDPLTVCPRCGGELRKVFGNVGIVFKGSGFYKTDSRSSNKAASSSSKTETKSEAVSASTASTESKGESKPSSSSEAKPAAAAS